MQLHELTREHPNKSKKRVGRGGKRGSYSGRGIKGQRAHAGGRIRPAIRDVIKKLHKRRGYGKNRSRSVSDARHEAMPVSISDIEKHFASGDVVSPATLAEKGVIEKKETSTPVKLLGGGELTKKVSVRNIAVSASARSAIEQSGGVIEEQAQ